jgi:ketosteroid isomerase-like protein
MDDHAQIVDVAYALTAAIAHKDTPTLVALLSPDFVLRTPGGPGVNAAEFIAGVQEIGVEIVFVRLEQLVVDVQDGTALVTGVQHARIREGGEMLDELRPFANWFVRGASGAWRLRIMLDLSEAASMVGTADSLAPTPETAAAALAGA